MSNSDTTAETVVRETLKNVAELRHSMAEHLELLKQAVVEAERLQRRLAFYRAALREIAGHTELKCAAKEIATEALHLGESL